MTKQPKFGEIVQGYSIPVLNEREIRAAAGILFLNLIIALMLVILKENFLMIKYFIIIFLSDFVIRLFISPRYAPTLILGRLIVSRQNPEYVGAIQKKFAWVIGLILAATMFGLMVIANTYSPITGIICLICLVFLFFESAFGICLGCLFYGWFYKEKAQYCPGEICDVKSRQAIQKTSKLQLFIVFAFIVYIVLSVIFIRDKISEKPHALWNFDGSSTTAQRH
jgi:hypothetical protein